MTTVRNEPSRIEGISLGFIKDATAFPMFFVAIVLLILYQDLNGLRGSIIGILVLAFFIDGSFTIQPRLHCTDVGFNEETIFVLSTYIVGATFIFGSLIYHLWSH